MNDLTQKIAAEKRQSLSAKGLAEHEAQLARLNDDVEAFVAQETVARGQPKGSRRSMTAATGGGGLSQGESAYQGYDIGNALSPDSRRSKTGVTKPGKV